YSLLIPRYRSSTLFPYTTLFRSQMAAGGSTYLPIKPVLAPARPLLTGVNACMPTPTVQSTGSQIRARTATRLLISMPSARITTRSEEHTSELQSRFDLVCRLLLE